MLKVMTMILIMIYTNDKPNRSNLFNVYVFFDTHLAVINPRLTFHYTNVRLLLESKEENIHPVKVPDTRRLVARRRLSKADVCFLVKGAEMKLRSRLKFHRMYGIQPLHCASSAEQKKRENN